jgi:hypothetical protein
MDRIEYYPDYIVRDWLDQYNLAEWRRRIAQKEFSHEN